MGTSGNFCFRGRDAENKLRHAALPDFATPRGNVKDSFDFFCLLHSPCPGQVLFILLEWDVWLEWGAASRPLFSQISSCPALHCPTPVPALPRGAHHKGQTALRGTEVTSTPPWLPGVPLYHGLAHKVPLNSHTSSGLGKWYCARTVTLGRQPWDCHLGTKNVSKAFDQMSKQAAKTHSGKKASF